MGLRINYSVGENVKHFEVNHNNSCAGYAIVFLSNALKSTLVAIVFPSTYSESDDFYFVPIVCLSIKNAKCLSFS